MLNAWSGSRYIYIARLASEADITSVTFSDDDSGTNQIGAFRKLAGTTTVGGKEYSVWRSNNLLVQAASVTVTTG